MDKKTLTMNFSKQTKNTVVYVSENQDGKPLIPTLYLNKSEMPAEFPKTIEVTVT